MFLRDIYYDFKLRRISFMSFLSVVCIITTFLIILYYKKYFYTDTAERFYVYLLFLDLFIPS